MARGIRLVAAGLAVAAAAGGSAAAMQLGGSAHGHTAPGAVAARSAPGVAARQAASAAARSAAGVAARSAPGVAGAGGVVTAVHDAGESALPRWWVSGGHRQYERAASDLSKLIVTDVLNDDDDTWVADSQRLVADATAASRNLPPVDGAAYHSAMVELARAGRESVDNSFDRAYAYVKLALPKLAAFNNVISARLSAAQLNAPVS
jgi:hypothetical protein